jgi:GrpB-like predicted nucleotidyltransferase (UPF0157 family)
MSGCRLRGALWARPPQSIGRQIARADRAPRHARILQVFGRMSTVVVVDYDDAWPRQFEALAARIWPAVQDVALSIEHIGSTSVPGLAAKPIIDMSIVVPSSTDIPIVVGKVAALGYRHRGNLGIEGREAFHQPPDLPRHHLYACPAGTVGLVNPLALRDYLRANADATRRYSALKKRLAREHADDVEGYTVPKTDFILSILRQVGLREEQLDAIELMNRQR